MQDFCREALTWRSLDHKFVLPCLRRRPRTLHLFFPRPVLLQHGKRTLFRYSAFTSPHIAREYLTSSNSTELGLRFINIMSKDLPVPPVQQVNNLVLLIGIIQKIIHALVESFRVS